LTHLRDERLSLPVEQAALLWCIRFWVANANANPDDVATHRIQDMLARLDAPDAAPYVEGFMFALSHGAIRQIGVACVCQPRIGPDERTLLDAMGLAQESRPFEALLLLRGLVTPDAARAALHSAEGLGAELALAGRFLPAPDSAVSLFAMPSEPGDAIWPEAPTLH
jgi:hypothetical protein